MIELDLKMENDPMKLCLYLLKFLETTESNSRLATSESTFWQLVVWYYGTTFLSESWNFGSMLYVMWDMHQGMSYYGAKFFLGIYIIYPFNVTFHRKN